MPPRAKKAAAAAPVQSPRVTRSKRKTADEMMDAPKDTPVKKAKVEEVEDPKSASKKAAKPASKKETAKETPKKKTAEEPKETPVKTENPKPASKPASKKTVEAKETPAKATPVKKPASKKETPAKATPKATPAKEKPASKKETPAKAEKPASKKETPAKAEKPASKKEAAKPASKAEKPASKKKEPKSILKKPAYKKAAKEPTPEPEAEAESDDESFIGAPSDSDGADSSDDESDAEDAAVKAAATRTEVSKLPHARDDASVAARLKRASKKKDAPRATVFLGRIPHGFYEEQMKEYFGQFGDVTRLRLARNPKTGASRHYAYIEFSSEPVAEIVADTMHNYLLMGHLLQCAVVPKDQVHPELWVGANKKFRKVPRARLEKVRNDKARTKEQQSKANAKVLARQDARRAKIKAAGIAYEFEGH
ncbi:hypothetical protein CspHIS471_0704210 [Cutaneotrichosporon sp. HIS471]|nr:hypothetical protein CspHIS471_0704210 [Cutaneotrichosporon sp. HIS471]